MDRDEMSKRQLLAITFSIAVVSVIVTVYSIGGKIAIPLWQAIPLLMFLSVLFFMGIGFAFFLAYNIFYWLELYEFITKSKHTVISVLKFMLIVYIVAIILYFIATAKTGER